jgi:hypothetical protein
LSQLISVPFSWATPSAGMMTLVGIEISSTVQSFNSSTSDSEKTARSSSSNRSNGSNRLDVSVSNPE